jgi:hypothetical protein
MRSLPSNLLGGNGNTLKLKTTANLTANKPRSPRLETYATFLTPLVSHYRLLLKDQILIDFSCLKNQLIRDFNNVTFMKVVSLTGLSSNLYRSGIFSWNAKL